jgi:hypothetical protein
VSKITYEHRNFRPDGRSVLDTADLICADYARQGYRLTLRQLYYQFVARNSFPDAWFVTLPDGSRTKNHDKNYKRLGELVSSGRISGMIDWAHITDTGRSPSGGDSGYDSPGDLVATDAAAYRVEHWTGQPEYTEVWVEKEALHDVISQAARRWDVTSFACKGYTSQSAMHDAAIRFRLKAREGKKCTLIHLGDHDPSGIDMTRDIEDRLALFRASITVDRIALNMDQIERLNPPPSPAKVTDSRATEYIENYGEDSWELDAIEPAELDSLVENAILEHLDQGMREARIAVEEEGKRLLRALGDNWDDVEAFLRDNGYVDTEE